MAHTKAGNGNCSNCFYYGKLAGIRCCKYFLETGERRPCKPGEGCTVKIASKIKRTGKKVKP